METQNNEHLESTQHIDEVQIIKQILKFILLKSLYILRRPLL